MSEAEALELLCRPEPRDWNGIARPDEEMQRLVTCLKAVQLLGIAEQFNTPVDLDKYPEYVFAIAYPLGLYFFFDLL